jgi:hypothetical protein
MEKYSSKLGPNLSLQPQQQGILNAKKTDSESTDVFKKVFLKIARQLVTFEEKETVELLNSNITLTQFLKSVVGKLVDNKITFNNLCVTPRLQHICEQLKNCSNPEADLLEKENLRNLVVELCGLYTLKHNSPPSPSFNYFGFNQGNPKIAQLTQIGLPNQIKKNNIAYLQPTLAMSKNNSEAINSSKKVFLEKLENPRSKTGPTQQQVTGMYNIKVITKEKLGYSLISVNVVTEKVNISYRLTIKYNC